MSGDRCVLGSQRGGVLKMGVRGVLLGLSLPIMVHAMDFQDGSPNKQKNTPTDAYYPPAFGPYKPHPAQAAGGRSNPSSNAGSKSFWDASMPPSRSVNSNSYPMQQYPSSRGSQPPRVSIGDSSYLSQKSNAPSSSDRYRPWDAEPMTSAVTTSNPRGPFSYRPESGQSRQPSSRQPSHSQPRSLALPKAKTRSQHSSPNYAGNGGRVNTGSLPQANAANPSWNYAPSSDPGERYWGPQANASYASTPTADYQRPYRNSATDRFSAPYGGQSRRYAPTWNAGPPVGMDAGQYYWGVR